MKTAYRREYGIFENEPWVNKAIHQSKVRIHIPFPSYSLLIKITHNCLKIDDRLFFSWGQRVCNFAAIRLFMSMTHKWYTRILSIFMGLDPKIFISCSRFFYDYLYDLAYSIFHVQNIFKLNMIYVKWASRWRKPTRFDQSE